MSALTLAFVTVGSNSKGGKATYNVDSFLANFTVSGGVGPYTWAISAGALPGTMSLTTYSGAFSCYAALSAPDVFIGSYSYTLTVSDSSTPTALTASLSFAYSVIQAPNLGTGVLGTPLVSGPISGLTLQAMPGFAEILLPALAYGLPLTSAVLKALNSTIKFAAVRTEYFYGYYADGDVVGLPISLADGYQYAREELRYIWSIYWTGSRPGQSPTGNPLAQSAGTLIEPGTGATSAQGQLLQFGYFVDPNTGGVSCTASYYQDSGQQSDTNDGILMVHTIAKRMR